MDAGDSVLLVADLGRTLAGFTQLYRCYSSASLGRVLILSTEHDNEPAQALYEEAGWVRDQRFYYYHFQPV